ncbi:MAG: hypothetical protein LC104_11510 [Bacteroidales bacterium]|nr:hypothetical protein [Bacteroidales bacterium]
MTMTAITPNRDLAARARDTLKRAGNPFRNYFARNPDDEVCARYHVPELFHAERDLLHAIIDLYRYDPQTHSEIVPILGNKGAGKTHLLHSIKHGTGGQWQLLVTPGVYQKDTDFLEYLLFQIIDTLLGGGKQKGARPLAFVGDQLVRRQLGVALRDLTPEDKVELFPPPGLGRWGKRLGLGVQQAAERADWLADNLSGYSNFARMPMPLAQALADAGMTPERALELICTYTEKTEARNTAGLMRRQIIQGFARAILLGDEGELAGFLTYGFAELEFHVRPTRQDLVLALFKVLTELFRGLKIPVVVAFDQLEDLLLARRSDDAHKTAEAFFAGIVQVMHQIDGLCFLVFAERGLWNRFVPSLDGYIQDRLNNPVHVPKFGTVKAIRLEAPTPALVQRVVEARLRPVLDEIPDATGLPEIHPFAEEQVDRIARTEPTLRDMLQQFRHLFDHLIYGPDDALPDTRRAQAEAAVTPSLEAMSPTVAEVGFGLASLEEESANPSMAALLGQPTEPAHAPPEPVAEKPLNRLPAMPESPATPAHEQQNRIHSLLGNAAEPTLPPQVMPPQVTFKSVSVVEIPAEPEPTPAPVAVPTATPAPAMMAATPPAAEEVPLVDPFPTVADNGSSAAVVKPTTKSTSMTQAMLAELWDQEFRTARRKLEPDGALTGATRELQAALGTLLTICHEHGVKVGPWRLQHVVPEWPFGDHPTYGAVTLAHWACKDGQPWKVGVGLFLARGAGKPKDLEIKLSVMDTEPQVVDHLILLRPEDDMSLTGKSKTLWAESERRGRSARLEAVSLDGYALLSSFPRWLAAVRESLPEGTPIPNLADLIQEKAEKLLEQVCMPIQS